MNSGTLRVLQINLNHCRAAQDMMMQVARDRVIDLLVVSEPYLTKGGGRWFCSRDRKAGIVIINRNVTAARPKKGKGSVALVIGDARVISVYVSPNESRTDLRRLISDIDGTTTDCDPDTKGTIVAGDLNAWAVACGARRTKKRGAILERYMRERGLVSCHRVNEPTFTRTSGHGASVIDVTLASESIRDRVRNWYVCDDETLSDHRSVMI